MQKPQNYPISDPNFEASILEDPQLSPIPRWHKTLVAERLRVRNEFNNPDIPWEEVIQKLKNQHDNI